MNFKQMVGLVFFSIGIVTQIYGLHQSGIVFTKSPAIPPITNSPVSPTERLPSQNRIDLPEQNQGIKYIVSGAILALLGVGIAIRYKK